jgi:hypothetical protein
MARQMRTPQLRSIMFNRDADFAILPFASGKRVAIPAP